MGSEFAETLKDGIKIIPVLLLSLSFHEWAHAFVANKLGDDTAERAGRLTLNPLAHIDPLGTLILPLLGLPFGWAKPVPIDASRFRRTVRMGTGIVLTSSAGPLSNFVLATICAVILALLARLAPGILTPDTGVNLLLVLMVRVNVTLGIFNLIPIPPLDGSRIVEGVLPFRMRGAWERFSRVAPILLLALLILPGGIIGRILAGPSNVVLSLLQRLVDAIV